MAFSGDLEHLSVMDVVQMMHQGRKSGTLTFRGRRGECRLVFSEGSIISANHGDDRVLVGRVLVESGAITAEALERALGEQQRAGAARKPLLATLIEAGNLEKEVAFRGLQTLIEMVIVDVLTWKGGTFALDPETAAVSDEFRYFPQHLGREVQFNAEYVLMDALRIYDERKDAGTIEDEEEEAAPAGSAEVAPEITADLLGLGDVDRLERRIPGVYLGLPDRPAPSPHRDRLGELAPGLTGAGLDELAAFLDGLPPRGAASGRPAVQVVYLGGDALMAYCLNLACRGAGLGLLATDQPGDVEPLLERFLGRDGAPVLVLDAAGATTGRGGQGTPADLRRSVAGRFPAVAVVQMVCPDSPGGFGLGFEDGVVTVLARPPLVAEGTAAAAALVAFLKDFPASVLACVRDREGWVAARLSRGLRALREVAEPADAALYLLREVAGTFGRAVTLVVRGNELVSERGIGIDPAAGREPAPVAGVRLAPAAGTPLSEALSSGRGHLGRLDDPAVRDGLFARIGAPLRAEAILLPLRVGGRTVSLTYGDGGGGDQAAASLGAWEVLAGLTGLALENALLRRKTGAPSP